MTNATTAPDVSAVTDLTARLRGNIERVIEGKPAAVDMALVALLAGGHLLIEDVPGVGKTMLARTLARSIDCSVRRIQFTADLLPSDITGVSVFNPQSRAFEFKPGGVFAHIVIGDEINRASPKTQSALLEAMEEAHVSVDGTTHDLPTPFMVFATQNPIEMQGTYPLPEAQRDRFMASISMGYPTRAAEVDMLEHHGAGNPLDALSAVTDAAGVLEAREAAGRVFVHPALKDYVVEIVAGTRTAESLRLGASPRASLHLLRAARARAAMDGRGYVIPEDVSSLAVPVLAHRVLLSHRAHTAQASTADAVAAIVASIPAPRRT
ncbi:MAG: MoxR family ATPase [Propionibacteriaceae bacterium]|nr:MoxR family ATPase [Propionibacteriaceae bacterium]